MAPTASRPRPAPGIGKDVGALDLKEAAYLAGLIRTPSGGDVVSDPETAIQLRTFVLQAMLRSRYITPAQAAEVEAIPLASYVALRTELDSTVTLQGVGAEYFVEYVRTQLLKTYSEDQVLRQGLRVQTSLNPLVQRQAYDAVYGLLDRAADPAGALVAVDPDGRVVAMVGGKNWEKSKVNLAVGEAGGGSGRQAGSTFKPFALAATVREGYTLESSFPGPAKLILPKADEGKDWEVSNYEDEYFGSINLIDATVSSVNTVYAQLADTLGPQKIIGTAKDLGISSPLAPVPSIALGTQNVSVLEMAGAYSTLARGGCATTPGSSPRSPSTTRCSRTTGPRARGSWSGPRPTRSTSPWSRSSTTGPAPPPRWRTPRCGARPAPPRTSATPGSPASPAS